jgi:hypothetical protein
VAPSHDGPMFVAPEGKRPGNERGTRRLAW